MVWNPVGDLKGPQGEPGPRGPRGPGAVQAPVSDRAVVSHAVPGASPFRYTCPPGQVRQFSVTGGAGVSTTLEVQEQSPAVYVGGTASTPVLTPGETIVVGWTTTAPTAIRSRALLTLEP